MPAGTYTVRELLEGQGAAGEDDYARIAIEGLAGDDTWICYRSGRHTYGELLEVERPPAVRDEPTGDPDAVPESALVARVAAFERFRYTRTGAHYPFELDGIQLPQAPPEKNNCCTFVEALVVRAWQDAHPGRFRWSRRRHNQMMIISDDLFAPVTCVVKAGMAEAGDADASPRPWSLLQGWREGGGGHTFLVVDHHVGSDRVLTLESNRGHALDGVGFRKLGNLRDHASRPPPRWWEDATAPTWQQIRSTYPERKLAVLKVTGCAWSGL